MANFRLFSVTCLFGLSCMAGCGRFDTETVDNSKSDSEQGSGQSAAAAAPVTIQEVDRAGFDAVVGGHRGKVVLVDFWATWCGPCRKHFPHTVELHRQFGEQGLAVVAVSMDDPRDDAVALSFLQSQGATFDNLISNYGVGTEGFEAFEIPDAIPYFTLYDRQGRLRYRFSPVFENAEEGEPLDNIDIRVRELLREDA